MGKQLRIDGMVDPHTHLRDLDWTHKATFASESRAAIAGGYWAIFDMPNTPPSTINRSRLDDKLAKIDTNSVCDWGLYLGASQSDNTHEFATTIDDTCGLKIFNNATTGDLLIEDQSLRDKIYANWQDKRPIALHAESVTILDLLALVRKYRRPTHFLHISTAEEIGYLRDAKEEGLPITIGICPHHLFLTEDDVSHLGAYGKMKPTLKTQADQDALWQGITDGIVDVIESDHAPHSKADKDSDNPPYGVPGLETTLPLMLTAVRDGRLSLENFIPMISMNVHQIYGLTCPTDTYTIVDLESEYVLKSENMLTACGWTPFEGMQVQGKVIETWIRGVKVYDGENILVDDGFGQNLFGT